MTTPQDHVIAFGPASIANVGPFYDVLGYCLDNLGDFVEARRTSEHTGITVTTVGPYSSELDVQIQGGRVKNCVEEVAGAIWEAHKISGSGVDLVLHKYMPTRSGLGSSAASCVAAAKAMISLLGIERTVTNTDINNFMMEGEKVSNHFYPDNIVPSYWGGFYIINNCWQDRIRTPENMVTLVILNQNLEEDLNGGASLVRPMLETGHRRDMVDEFFREIMDSKSPDRVDRVLNYIRFQSRNASRLIHSLTVGNIKKAGEAISDTEYSFLCEVRDVDTCRLELWEMREQLGALGCSIAGSGPSVFMLFDSKEQAMTAKDKLLKMPNYENAYWLISDVNQQGAELCTDISARVRAMQKWNNFW